MAAIAAADYISYFGECGAVFEIESVLYRCQFLLFMDLNDMKSINDRFGHEMGDRALIETADVMKRFFRKSDILSRLGGDEFVVLMIAGKNDTDENAVVRRLQEKFTEVTNRTDSPYE